MKVRAEEAGAEEAGEPPKDDAPETAPNKGISKLDFIMRIVAVIGTLASAIAMGTTNKSFPVFTQFVHFRSQYNNLPTFAFFVVANAIVSAYLVLSLPLSIFHVVKSGARATRTVLIVFDMAMLTFLTSGASAATAIVHLAHKGNAQASWIAICQQFNSYCERASGSLVGSFIGIIALMLVIFLSAVALSRN